MAGNHNIEYFSDADRKYNRVKKGFWYLLGLSLVLFFITLVLSMQIDIDQFPQLYILVFVLPSATGYAVLGYVSGKSTVSDNISDYVRSQADKFWRMAVSTSSVPISMLFLHYYTHRSWIVSDLLLFFPSIAGVISFTLGQRIEIRRQVRGS